MAQKPSKLKIVGVIASILALALVLNWGMNSLNHAMFPPDKPVTTAK